MKIGQVVTNGINHWMVWKIEKSGGCYKCGEGVQSTEYVVPVIYNKEKGEIEHICFDWRGEYWFNKTLSSIKPRYWFVEDIYNDQVSLTP